MLHCNCSFKFAMHHLFKSSAWRKTECKHEKIRISWNIRGFCVWLYNSIPHFSSGSFSTTFEWISRKTVDGKEAIRKRRPQCFTTQQTLKWIFPLRFCFARSWKCQVQGIGTLEENGCWLFVWFTRRDRMISSEIMCCTTFFDVVNSSMVNVFVFSNFQLFSTFFNFFS
jgi:hypothetical protein